MTANLSLYFGIDPIVVLETINELGRDEAIDALVWGATALARAQIAELPARSTEDAMKAWICYDLRTLDDQASAARLTAAAIEQAAWADDKAFDAVLLPEHHGSPDGYVSSPFVLGGAIAARTSRIRIVTTAVLMPLLNPIRVAEDAATLDVISHGRLTLGVNLGYGPSEFEMFGVSFSQRVSKLEAGISVLRQAFTGEEFTLEVVEPG